MKFKNILKFFFGKIFQLCNFLKLFPLIETQDDMEGGGGCLVYEGGGGIINAGVVIGVDITRRCAGCVLLLIMGLGGEGSERYETVGL